MIHPSEYHPDLTEARLNFVASKILEQVYLSYETNNTEYDDAYTVGCVIFGRVKNWLDTEGASADRNWLSIVKRGMDFTGRIGSVPFRFASDNPEAPRKEHIFKQSIQELQQSEQMSLDLSDSDTFSLQANLKWRWYIKKAHTEEDIPEVAFVGLNAMNEPECTWTFDSMVPTLHSVDGGIPAKKLITEAPVRLPAAKISIKKPKQ